jgi:hypothetical protein
VPEKNQPPEKSKSNILIMKPKKQPGDEKNKEKGHLRWPGFGDKK